MNSKNSNNRIVVGALLAGLSLVVAGCDEPGTSAADNTSRNARDRDANAVTPMDQGNSTSDLRITADLRKDLVSDSEFSTNAQNCKIITKNGVVTLRGPVNSQAEKDRIASRATSISGVVSVINELEVKP